MTTQPDPVHHLLDRLLRGVLLPEEGEQLAGAVRILQARVNDQDGAASVAVTAVRLMNEAGAQRDRAEARVRELEAEVHHYEEVVVGDLNEANIGLQRQAATAEARVRELEQRDTSLTHIATVACQQNQVLGESLRADPDPQAALTVYLAAEDRIRDLEAQVARLTAGQCTHALAVCEQHHAKPVASCPYPRCRAARDHDQRAPTA